MCLEARRFFRTGFIVVTVERAAAFLQPSFGGQDRPTRKHCKGVGPPVAVAMDPIASDSDEILDGVGHDAILDQVKPSLAIADGPVDSAISSSFESKASDEVLRSVRIIAVPDGIADSIEGQSLLYENRLETWGYCRYKGYLSYWNY